MAANILTFLLALALIVSPVIVPVYESAGFDTAEIMQTAQDITGIDYTEYASDTATPSIEKPAAEPAKGTKETGSAPPQTSQPTPTPGTPTSKPGAELITGDWQGEKSLFFGAASAEFYLSADRYGNMTISGTAEAPIAGYEETPFALDAEWTYLGDYQFKGEAQGSSLDFTCDGTKISLTANPYELGFIDNEMANMDIYIELTRDST
ncbi:MAG: hypothetical protein Q4Q20_00925 [Methanocorpusculum sp.]|nr:hypothetical protein [Methanocorpusculum sp.]